jgi:8-oxo-dGTP pyrophosphatase MutT (NUDIX family)
MRKDFSLVFFVRINKGKKEIMMGKKNSPNKPKLHGKRNGFGGGCEGNENTVECAIREVEEETRISKDSRGIELDKKDLISVGKIIDKNDGRNVEIFFVIWDEERFLKIPNDNGDFNDVRFFDIEKVEEFLPDMMRQNDELVGRLNSKLEELKNEGGIYSEVFIVDETNNENQELRAQISEIYKGR